MKPKDQQITEKRQELIAVLADPNKYFNWLEQNNNISLNFLKSTLKDGSNAIQWALVGRADKGPVYQKPQDNKLPFCWIIKKFGLDLKIDDIPSIYSPNYEFSEYIAKNTRFLKLYSDTHAISSQLIKKKLDLLIELQDSKERLFEILEKYQKGEQISLVFLVEVAKKAYMLGFDKTIDLLRKNIDPAILSPHLELVCAGPNSGESCPQNEHAIQKCYEAAGFAKASGSYANQKKFLLEALSWAMQIDDLGVKQETLKKIAQDYIFEHPSIGDNKNLSEELITNILEATTAEDCLAILNEFKLLIQSQKIKELTAKVNKLSVKDSSDPEVEALLTEYLQPVMFSVPPQVG